MSHRSAHVLIVGEVGE